MVNTPFLPSFLFLWRATSSIVEETISLPSPRPPQPIWHFPIPQPTLLHGLPRDPSLILNTHIEWKATTTQWQHRNLTHDRGGGLRRVSVDLTKRLAGKGFMQWGSLGLGGGEVHNLTWGLTETHQFSEWCGLAWDRVVSIVAFALRWTTTRCFTLCGGRASRRTRGSHYHGSWTPQRGQ